MTKTEFDLRIARLLSGIPEPPFRKELFSLACDKECHALVAKHASKLGVSRSKALRDLLLGKAKKP